MRAGGICRSEGKVYDTRSATYLLIAANPTISSYGSRNELPSASPQGAPVVEPRRVGAVVELDQCGESGEIFWLTVRGSRGASNDSSFFLARCSRNPRAPAEVPDGAVQMVGTCAVDACRVKDVVMVPVCWRCIVRTVKDATVQFAESSHQPSGDQQRHHKVTKSCQFFNEPEAIHSFSFDFGIDTIQNRTQLLGSKWQEAFTSLSRNATSRSHPPPQRGVKLKKIAEHLDLNAKLVESMIARTKSRAATHDLNSLERAISSQPSTGKPKVGLKASL